MNPSARSHIACFRVCIESVTTSSVRPRWATSRSLRACGMNPTTSPPAASAASATVPINPTRPPPYTTVCPAAASDAPSSHATTVSAGSPPGFDPQNTQTLAMRHMVASLPDREDDGYPAVMSGP